MDTACGRITIVIRTDITIIAVKLGATYAYTIRTGVVSRTVIAITTGRAVGIRRHTVISIFITGFLTIVVPIRTSTGVTTTNALAGLALVC